MTLLMSVFRISEPFLFRLNLEGNCVSGNKSLKVPTIDVDLSPIDCVIRLSRSKIRHQVFALDRIFEVMDPFS